MRQVRSEVRAAFVQVQHADASLMAEREGATQALELANAMWKAGATTSVELFVPSGAFPN